MKRIVIFGAAVALLFASCASSSVWLASGQLHKASVTFEEGARDVTLARDYQALLSVFNLYGVSQSDYDAMLWYRVERPSVRQAMSRYNAEFLVWEEGQDSLYVIRRSTDGYEQGVFTISGAGR